MAKYRGCLYDLESYISRCSMSDSSHCNLVMSERRGRWSCLGLPVIRWLVFYDGNERIHASYGSTLNRCADDEAFANGAGRQRWRATTAKSFIESQTSTVLQVGLCITRSIVLTTERECII